MGLAKRIDDYCIFVSRENLLVKGKCMKKTWTKVLAYMLAVTMCFSAVNVPVYAQESTVIKRLQNVHGKRRNRSLVSYR